MAGLLAIEFFDIRNGGNISLAIGNDSVDSLPITYTNSSFQAMVTSTTSADSSAPPATATHARVSSMTNGHYIRFTNAPTTGSGGIAVPEGTHRYILLQDLGDLKVVSIT